MALALNVYQTVTGISTTGEVGIYTAPTGYSAIVLLAQATNINNNSTETINLSLERSVAGTAQTTEMLMGFPVPANDAANLLNGKLVLETQDVLLLSSSSDTNVKYVVSILETLNQ